MVDQNEDLHLVMFYPPLKHTEFRQLGIYGITSVKAFPLIPKEHSKRFNSIR